MPRPRGRFAVRIIFPLTKKVAPQHFDAGAAHEDDAGDIDRCQRRQRVTRQDQHAVALEGPKAKKDDGKPWDRICQWEGWGNRQAEEKCRQRNAESRGQCACVGIDQPGESRAKKPLKFSVNSDSDPEHFFQDGIRDAFGEHDFWKPRPVPECDSQPADRNRNSKRNREKRN